MFHNPRIRRWVSAVLIVALVLRTQAGCEQRSQEKRTVFRDQEADYLLAVVLDMSGSFTDKMLKDDGKAYRYFMQLTDRFFRDRLGSNDRIIIAQLSGTSNTLLWDGNPRSLRRDFPSARAFKDFLIARSNPSASRVHAAVADTLDYVMGYPGVTEGKTRSAVFVLSDMVDTDGAGSKNRVHQSLEKYGKVGGTVGLYWVEQSLVSAWQQYLRQSGVRNFVVVPEIVTDPPMPVFD